MAQYCTIGQLETFGTSAKALAKLQAPKKLAAIEAASGKIDSYLKKVFTLPLVQVGTDLVRCCAIIAAYDLLSGEGLNPLGNDENVRLRYLDELKWLQLVADGEVTPDAGGQPPNPALPPSGRPRVVSAPSRGYSVRGTGVPRGPFQGA
jgi:phage gp36-like protein